jgi:membrane protein required for colicin V production
MLFVDYLLLAILLVSTLLSLFRGFFKEALSLISWIVAIWAAAQFGPMVAEMLGGTVESYTLRLWGGRGLIVVGLLFLGGLISWLISTLLENTGLSGTDRAVGMVFGLARGAVLVGVFVLLLEFAGFAEASWWDDSKLIPYAAPVADLVREVAEDGMEYLDIDEQPASKLL